MFESVAGARMRHQSAGSRAESCFGAELLGVGVVGGPDRRDRATSANSRGGVAGA